MATKTKETKAKAKEAPNKCACGNSLFPHQFRCEVCGAIQPEYIVKETNKEEK